MTSENARPGWKTPTIQAIADVAGVGPATVDRVLNNREGVRAKTRQRVLAALEKLRDEAGAPAARLELRLFCDSGESFNAAMQAAVAAANGRLPGIFIRDHYERTSQTDPMALAREIAEHGAAAQGAIVIAREHPAINRAIRKLESCGVPVVCLTSDLPSSRRSAYIGNDQYAAGSVAGLLIGSALEKREGQRILLVMSEPFRCQQEREMGFRRALRNDFPYLRIEERVIVDDDPDNSWAHVRQYIDTAGPPAAIYNVAGANRGVARALKDIGRAEETMFVGHELTRNSRILLEEKVMDYVISHDVAAEVASAAGWIRDWHQGLRTEPPFTPILLHTRYNCGL
ncbi:LacI family DNA-binding transcriptional regulator [Poseidonocella sp. HB161398]|uniref:LacI family DNA-binding transcriptional regulator n=1 Tax=Poseidonocella sp. HB161398 TaxID=2320855 RepID=UPI00110832DF|nr:LacI family DNA-binding transcriptional regulator [Poseidonocella sp. HB161398]